MNAEQKRGKLWEVCEDFIKEQEISCPDAVYQCDRVIENALQLIEKIGELVGWHHDGNVTRRKPPGFSPCG